ncbi:MAG: hypothetical protein JNG88_13445, partial [Phycisphaerales bacterium]|nr:hypothetical protein [Phycisphaerales bacterium]
MTITSLRRTLAIALVGVSAAAIANAADTAALLTSEAVESTMSTDPIYVPDLSKFLPAAGNRESLSSTLQIFVLMTVLTLLPSIVLMNPPFSVMANVEGRMADAAYRHVASALARLTPGGRLVAITGA